MILEKITIVIPTFKRQEYILRTMEYWSGKGAKVMVLDGTDQAIPAELLSHIEDNVRYHHMPVSFAKRIDHARAMIETPYVALSGDDEFHLPTGLIQSIRELETDENLIACMGRTMAFRNDDGIIRGKIEYPAMKDYSLSDSEPCERMVRHMRCYTPSTIYAVVRSWAWRLAWEPTCREEFPVYGSAELAYELMISYLGKSKVIPVLQWLRSKENTSVVSEDVSLNSTNPRFYLWWGSSSYGQQKEAFLDNLMKSLEDGLEIGEQRIRECVSSAYDAYVVLVKERARPSRKRAKIGLFLKNCLSKRQIIIVKSFMNAFRKSKTLPIFLTTLEECAQLLENDGVSADYGELQAIEHRLSNFHRAKATDV